jgi:hypothetical protein
MPLVEQELLTLPEHQSSPPVFSGIRVTRSLVLCVSYGHCVVCSSSIYGFWLPIWYLQTLHIPTNTSIKHRSTKKTRIFIVAFLCAFLMHVNISELKCAMTLMSAWVWTLNASLIHPTVKLVAYVNFCYIIFRQNR